jgi:hypothetical protein
MPTIKARTTRAKKLRDLACRFRVSACEMQREPYSGWMTSTATDLDQAAKEIEAQVPPQATDLI